MAALVVSKWRQFRRNRRLGWNTLHYLVVCACQIGITLVYPLYNYTFVRLNPSEQTLFVLLLPVLKIAVKNWIARALDSADVGMPEAVVFNIEIFHVLYLAFCMQSAASTRTVFALMSVDVVQAWLSFNDMQGLLRELTPVANKLDAAWRQGRDAAARQTLAPCHLLWLATRVVEVEPQMGIHKRTQRKPRLRASILRSLHASWKRVVTSVGPAPDDIRPTATASLHSPANLPPGETPICSVTPRTQPN